MKTYKKDQYKQPLALEEKLELFRNEAIENPATSLFEINKAYQFSKTILYEELLIELAYSLDKNRLKLFIDDAKKLKHSVANFFKDSFSHVQLKVETIPLPNQVQWLANWTTYLLFNDDQSPRYPDVESADFKQFIDYLEQNYDDNKLPLSLRLRFGLLLAYSYIIPIIKDANQASFEMNPRVLRCPLNISPKDIHVACDDYRLQMVLYWLKQIMTLSGCHKQDTLNLRADCNDLLYQFNKHFFPQYLYNTLCNIGQAFFSAASNFQSITYPSGPDDEAEIEHVSVRN